MSDPRMEGQTPEVRRPEGSTLPGAPKGYGISPTAPVPFPLTNSDPQTVAADWEPSTAPVATPVDDARLAPWALLAAVVALVTSMFVGWGIPVAIVAVIAAIMSLRRPMESRAMALWALVLGLCATLFSAGWLIWAIMQFESLV